MGLTYAQLCSLIDKAGNLLLHDIPDDVRADVGKFLLLAGSYNDAPAGPDAEYVLSGQIEKLVNRATLAIKNTPIRDVRRDLPQEYVEVWQLQPGNTFIIVNQTSCPAMVFQGKTERYSLATRSSSAILAQPDLIHIPNSTVVREISKVLS